MITRRTAVRQVRQEAAELAFLRSHPQHLSNGEESAYRNPALGTLNYIANYSKGLPTRIRSTRWIPPPTAPC